MGVGPAGSAPETDMKPREDEPKLVETIVRSFSDSGDDNGPTTHDEVRDKTARGDEEATTVVGAMSPEVEPVALSAFAQWPSPALFGHQSCCFTLARFFGPPDC